MEPNLNATMALPAVAKLARIPAVAITTAYHQKLLPQSVSQ